MNSLELLQIQINTIKIRLDEIWGAIQALESRLTDLEDRVTENGG